MEEAELRTILKKSVETLYAEESTIIRFDVGERTICACLAAILKRHFGALSVHVEYNRRGIYPKDIELPNSAGILTQNRVYPDIIVHEPGHDDANLLVIEVKKTTNNAPDELDIAKLELIKQQIGYRFAVFIRLAAGENAKLEDVRYAFL
jgi:hypothetical protein